MITVVVKESGKAPEAKQIDGDIKSIQGIVGGYFECHAFSAGTTVYCNEDAVHQYLPPNIVDMCHGSILRGTVLIMDGDNGLPASKVPRVIKALEARAILGSL
jgi:hypothetical protein